MLLKDIIKGFKKEMMQLQLKRLGIETAPGMKKPEIADKLNETLLDPGVMTMIFSAASPEEIDFMDEAAQGISVMPENPLDVLNVGMFGYLAPAENGLILPDDVRNMYRIIRWSAPFMKNREVLWPLIDYLNAFVSLYGVVRTDTAIDMYRKYEGGRISESEIKRCLPLTGLRNDPFIAFDEVIMHRTLAEEMAWQVLLEVQGDKPFYMPPKWMINAYANEWYYDKTPEYYALYDRVAELAKNSEENASELMDNITYAIQDEDNLDGMLEEVSSMMGVVFDDRTERMNFSMLLTNYINNTRLWSNRGFTQHEMYMLERKERMKNAREREGQKASFKNNGSGGKVLDFESIKK